MSKIIDLTGQRFGKLIAIEKTNKRSSGGGIIWRCRCDCGNEKNVVSGNLTSRHVRSCGCFQKHDKIGHRFGKLTVIKKTNKRSSHGAVIWQCKCDCGNEKNVTTGHLVNGSTKSCGCLLEKNNLAGQRIGRLFVIEKTNKRSSLKTVIWRCRCDCGIECEFSTGDLKGGHIRNCISCGNITSLIYKGKTYFRVSITKNNKTYRQWFDELSRALIVNEHVLSLYNKGISNWNARF
ncbi:hypothetical protein [Lactococcus lactis]|uniref:hypothetical protein n=1 Tax=Lactococcus lactis TaxID=1358 RepID=UPI00288EA4B4|nr:hypothetical protein [Lactococcus lactis]MDT2909320.1 hypothetical protein [Lactococcus lactis]MDT2925150.1 hypothetical protein [Lactococcus lactis]MDT2952009.1 hypothetical protein [Lactococcus lactis]